MDLFRGTAFHHGWVPENSPLALTGRLPSFMGRFLDLNGTFPRMPQWTGRFPFLKISLKTAH